MSNTSVEVEMNLLNNDLRKYINVSSSSNSSFCNLDNLKTSTTTPTTSFEYIDFITLEPNINILDGTLLPLNRSNKYTYIKSSLSDKNCYNSGGFTITLNSSCPAKCKSIAGVGLYFGTTKAVDTVLVTYRKDANTIMKEEYFTPTFKEGSSTYNVYFGCQGFNRININFRYTKFPYMYSRLQYLDFGFLNTFDSNEIIECKITEEVDPISNIVPINTCKLTVYSFDNIFNVLNDDGFYDYLKDNQEFLIYGIIDNRKFLIGKFYLDTWEGTKDNEATFNLISLLGILDRTKYTKGKLKKYDSAYDTIEYILDGILTQNQYEISDELNDIDIGYCLIKNNISVKDALQVIAFTVNACIDDTRDGILKIYPQQKSTQFILSSNEIFRPVKITKNETVTGIDVSVYTYDENNFSIDNPSDIASYTSLAFDGVLASNERKTFLFDKPISDWGIIYKFNNDEEWYDWADYIEGEYSFTFRASKGAGHYLIRVALTQENVKIYSKRAETNIYSDVKPNIIKVDNNTVLRETERDSLGEIKGTLEPFADNLMEYYKDSDLKIEFSFLFKSTVKAGAYGGIFTDYNKYCQGHIIKQDIDLTGGFISTCTALSTNRNLNTYTFMSGERPYEMYASNNILI